MYQSVLKINVLLIALISCGVSFGMNEERTGDVISEKTDYEKIFCLRVQLFGAGYDGRIIRVQMPRDESDLYRVGNMKKAISDYLHGKGKVTCSVDSMNFINDGKLCPDDKAVFNPKQLKEMVFALIKDVSNNQKQ
jgi:hypothetical protein